MEEKSILTIGDSTIDQIICIDKENAALSVNKRTREKEICFNYGEKIPVSETNRDFGGSALNVAIGFARQNIKTYIATIVGNDEEGKEVLDFLHKNKVLLNGSAVNGKTNQAFIILYDSERTILSHHEQRNYNKIKIPKTDWIYFASAAKGAEILIDKLIASAKSGARIVFNPGSWELEKFPLFAPLVKWCEIFIINRDEADLIFGPKEISSQLKEMKALGAKINIITCGSSGAYISQDDHRFHMNIFAGTAVDPTGAGDSFSSGFVGGIIYNKNAVSAAKWGMINSSSVISKVGATDGLLSNNQMERALLSASSLRETKI